MNPIEQYATKAIARWLTSSPPPAGIQLALARTCVAAAALAYQEITFSSPLAQVLVLSPKSGVPETIIAFRGSANARAWLTDFRIGFTQTDFGRIHTGFWQSSDSVLPEILRLPQVQSALPVIITGHSKGAAEAKICARRLRAAGKPVAGVVTFGGPRCGDATWRKNYNDALGTVTQRWVHEEDIVPRMPPWISRYRQVAHEYFISSLGGIQLNPSLMCLAASDLWGTFWGYSHGHLEEVIDHPITKYQQHLNSL